MDSSLENLASELPESTTSLVDKRCHDEKESFTVDLFVTCGELSGDLALANLLEPLIRKINPKRVGGVLGPHLRALGFCEWRNLDGLQVMGFTAVLRSFFFFRRHLKKLTQQIVEMKPAVVICVDYPGFHLRLAKSLRKAGYFGRLVQYISPTIWAWKPGRLKVLEQCFDEVWGIFPFEKKLFEGKLVDYAYVGNPSLRIAQRYHMDFFSKNPPLEKNLSSLKQKTDLSLIPSNDLPLPRHQSPISQLPLLEDRSKETAFSSRTYLGLFPGSRPKEIQDHLPLLLKAAEIVEKKLGKQNWYLALASHEVQKSVESTLAQSSLEIECVQPYDHQRKKAQTKAALAVSGTVCLELALCSIPTVAIYQISRINYWIAKYFLRLKLKAFTLPNIILGKSVFPECLGVNVKPEAIAAPLVRWLAPHSPDRLAIQEALDELYLYMVKCEERSQKNQVIHDLIIWLEKDKGSNE